MHFYTLADAAVTLDGKSYIIYRLKKSFDELFTKFQISFRTESLARSTIFDASGKDFFRLEVGYYFVSPGQHLKRFSVVLFVWTNVFCSRCFEHVFYLTMFSHSVFLCTPRYRLTRSFPNFQKVFLLEENPGPIFHIILQYFKLFFRFIRIRDRELVVVVYLFIIIIIFANVKEYLRKYACF